MFEFIKTSLKGVNITGISALVSYLASLDLMPINIGLIKRIILSEFLANPATFNIEEHPLLEKIKSLKEQKRNENLIQDLEEMVEIIASIHASDERLDHLLSREPHYLDKLEFLNSLNESQLASDNEFVINAKNIVRQFEKKEKKELETLRAERKKNNSKLLKLLKSCDEEDKDLIDSIFLDFYHAGMTEKMIQREYANCLLGFFLKRSDTQLDELSTSIQKHLKKQIFKKLFSEIKKENTNFTDLIKSDLEKLINNIEDISQVKDALQNIYHNLTENLNLSEQEISNILLDWLKVTFDISDDASQLILKDPMQNFAVIIQQLVEYEAKNIYQENILFHEVNIYGLHESHVPLVLRGLDGKVSDQERMDFVRNSIKLDGNKLTVNFAGEIVKDNQLANFTISTLTMPNYIGDSSSPVFYHSGSGDNISFSNLLNVAAHYAGGGGSITLIGNAEAIDLSLYNFNPNSTLDISTDLREKTLKYTHHQSILGNFKLEFIEGTKETLRFRITDPILSSSLLNGEQVLTFPQLIHSENDVILFFLLNACVTLAKSKDNIQFEFEVGKHEKQAIVKLYIIENGVRKIYYETDNEKQESQFESKAKTSTDYSFVQNAHEDLKEEPNRVAKLANLTSNLAQHRLGETSNNNDYAKQFLLYRGIDVSEDKSSVAVSGMFCQLHPQSASLKPPVLRIFDYLPTFTRSTVEASLGKK